MSSTNNFIEKWLSIKDLQIWLNRREDSLVKGITTIYPYKELSNERSS